MIHKISTTYRKDVDRPWMVWFKILYTLLAFIICPVYWYQYGVTNFLWFSDIAFFLMVPALWFRQSFIASMMAIGVLPLEILWMLSFITGGAFLGMADYMFDPNLPLWLRSLSLFHFPMPAAIMIMIGRFGYDQRALLPQICLSIVVILFTHIFTKRVDNVNMIFPIKELENVMSQSVYSFAMPVVLVTCVIIPMHIILKKYFPLRSIEHQKATYI